jgi:tRNA (cytidine/uridine-2'-O-)-methyltransferase
MINVALYQPDIPQNTAAIVRLSACLDIKLHIIEPCGFDIGDSRFKRVVMDYGKLTKIYRYESFDIFKEKSKSRIILMTTKAKKNYYNFEFKKNDILLFGRESAGVPKEIHETIVDKLKIPMNKKTRSLNVAMSLAIVSTEALRQLKI